MAGMVFSMPAMPDSRNWFKPVPMTRRRRLPASRRDGIDIKTAGKQLANFASNDYLGLSYHPAVCRAASAAITAQGFGSGASRLISGDCTELHKLESRLARWKGYEATLVVGSGMLANIGLLDALADRYTHLFCDRLNHASLVDGARLGQGRVRRFPHLDTASLEAGLARQGPGHCIIVSDGVFSMDGDCADVSALLNLANTYDTLLVLDDAHGTGVLGPDGRGLAAESGACGHPRVIEVGTLGKALGGYGAFILGTTEIIEGLKQRLRTMIYSTALPPALPAAALAALRLVRQGVARQRLRKNLTFFLHCADSSGIRLMPSLTPIQPMMIGDDSAALQASQCLREAGFFVPAIRPPTVPEGTARLRITLSAAHTEAQIEGLVNALGNVQG